MTSRSTSRNGGYVSDLRRDPDDDVDMEIHQDGPVVRRIGSDEPVSRILSSLDRLGERIRALSAVADDGETARKQPDARWVADDSDAAPVVNVQPEPIAPPRRDVGRRRPRGEAGLELQRAIEQIARRRDALERPAATEAVADPERRRADRPRRGRVEADPIPAPFRDGGFDELRAEIGDIRRTMDLRDTVNREDHLTEIRRLGDRLDAVARTAVDSRAFTALREDLQVLRDAVTDSAPTSQLRAMEAGYDEIVRRLDQMRGAIENPRMVGDLVQRMAEIRKLLAQAPTEGQIAALADRIDTIARQVDSDSQPDVAALETQVARLATAVAELDPSPLIGAIDTRLADVADQVAAIEKRLGGLDGVVRVQDVLERQAAVLSQLTQRTEQMPRVAHEMERQSATLDGLARHAEAMPRIAAGVDGMRRLIDSDAAEKTRVLEGVSRRLDDLAARLDGSTGAPDPALGNQIAEIAARLSRIEGPVDLAALSAIEARFTVLARSVEERFGAMEAMAARISLPAELLDSLARIEDQLSGTVPLDRFAGLEDRVVDLTDAVAGLGRLSAPDLSALEAAIAGIRDEVVAIGGTSFEALRRDIKDVSVRLDTLPHARLDTGVIDRLEMRVSEVLRRLDETPHDAKLLAEALGRFEGTVETALAARHDGPGQGKPAADALDGLSRLQQDVAALRDDIQAGALRDRDLIAAVATIVDQLAVREPAAVVAPVQPRPAAAPARPVAAVPAEDADSWSEIERTLAASLKAKGAPDRAGPDLDDQSALFGRRGEVRPAQAPIPVADPRFAGDDLPPENIDLPLEPGSGKPVRRMAPKADPATSRAARPDLPGDRPAGPSAGARPDPALRAEPSKADFIAAARRAAQAAGAEPLGQTVPLRSRSTAARLLGALKAARPGKAAAPSAKAPADPAAAPAGLTSTASFLAAHRTRILAGAAIVAVAFLGARVGLPLLLGDSAAVDVAVTADETPAVAAAPTADESTSPAAGVTVDVAAPPAGSDGIAPPSTQSVDVGSLVPTEPGTGPSAMPAPPTVPDIALQPAPQGPTTSFGDTAAALPADSFAPRAAGTETAAPTGLPLPPEAVGSLALRQAAAAGDTAAQFEVAARLTEGRGVQQDLGEAIRWYRFAADAGLAPAQYRLASLYEKGQGVARDAKAAAALYETAASAGNVKAMHNLAVLNAEGQLGEPDYAAAAKWFEAAADHGVRDSQYNLGILYAKGLGAPRDLTASYKWFAIAAQGGDADAAKKRDDVAQVLDRDALARARLAVETWSAKIPAPASNDVDTANPAWAAVPDQTASIGAGGADPVAVAQALLSERGYDPGPADGQMGKRTRDAIVAFQKARGLPETGTVDPGLIQALNDREI